MEIPDSAERRCSRSVLFKTRSVDLHPRLARGENSRAAGQDHERLRPRSRRTRCRGMGTSQRCHSACPSRASTPYGCTCHQRHINVLLSWQWSPWSPRHRRRALLPLQHLYCYRLVLACFLLGSFATPESPIAALGQHQAPLLESFFKIPHNDFRYSTKSFFSCSVKPSFLKSL